MSEGLNRRTIQLPLKRIQYLKDRIRMRDLMTHFGHRYRLHGNMICPWHEEKRPSARLYDEQDTIWCWVCSPNVGVDVIEFVIIELGLEATVDPKSQMPERRRHALATIRAIDYLEDAFGISYQAEPWEARLQESLRRSIPREDPVRYWRDRHTQLLRVLAALDHPDKWRVYSDSLAELNWMQNEPIKVQVPAWNQAQRALSNIELDDRVSL